LTRATSIDLLTKTKSIDPFTRTIGASLILVTVACQAGPQSPPTPALRDTHEGLHSVLWVQTAAEYYASCATVYEQAKAALARGLADRTWTAASEQTGSFGRLPPAVVLDLDETVFDNSPFQGTLVRDRTIYTPAAWDAWVSRAEAGAVPGAVEFLRFARERRVAVFYISNRGHAQEQDTVANLIKLGAPVDPAGQSVLSPGERPEWASEKAPRRAFVAKTHRIVLLIGDDLGDFVAGSRDLPEQRLQLARANARQWGTRWFLLPNPMYGSWERATYGNEGSLPDAEVLKRKIGRVRTYQ
jgi:acid phosphatase